jgi:CubicO group peptidase (beta-lactamase class C family)
VTDVRLGKARAHAAPVRVRVGVRLVGGALALVAAVLTPDTTVHAQMSRGGATDLTAVTDKVFDAWNSTHGPGCAVGIARGGKTLLTRGYGMADLAGERPITASTVLESGSVAKQFTATAVLLLMQDGKLSLEDDARRYLPELPQYGRTITVRHLLTHTSGLREWGNLVGWQGWPRGTRLHTQDVVFDLITRQKSLNYPVGDYYSYTNSGFLLLRTLVERVSGMPFAAFTAQRIFTPLGMTQTRWRDDYTTIVPGLAQAYQRTPDGWHLDMPFDNIIGAGGLWSTVGDWLIWNDALTKKTLGQAVGDSITRQMKLTSGLEIQYALGLTVSDYRGLKQIAHSGSTSGYSTYLVRYPSQDNLSIAVMCNSAGAPAAEYAHAIVDAMVPTLMSQMGPELGSVPVADMQKLAGLYRDTRTNAITTVDVNQDQLRWGGARLQPLKDGTYMRGGSRMRFVTNTAGAPTALQPTTDGDTVIWVREATSRWVPTATELAPLAGRYRNEEIGATYVVAATDGRLTISVGPGRTETLRPAYRDMFEGSGETVWFTRDKRGRVTAMHFGSGRAWDFVSARIP